MARKRPCRPEAGASQMMSSGTPLPPAPPPGSKPLSLHGNTPAATAPPAPADPLTPDEKPLTFLDYVEGRPSVPAIAHAFRIAILYFLFGVLWIAATDYGLNLLTKATGNTRLY